MLLVVGLVDFPPPLWRQQVPGCLFGALAVDPPLRQLVLLVVS